MRDTWMEQRMRDWERECRAAGDEPTDTHRYFARASFMEERLREMERRVDALRGALVFYTQSDLYVEAHCYHEPILDDAGHEARKALRWLKQRETEYGA